MKTRTIPLLPVSFGTIGRCLLKGLLAVSFGVLPFQDALAAYPDVDHVFVFVLENKGLKEIIGNPDAPYINRLSRRHALFTNYHAMAHPSLPNYVALISGKTGKTFTDDPHLRFSEPTVVEAMENRGMAVRGYFQAMPAPGFLEDAYPPSNPLYVLKHNPFFLFDRMRDNPGWRRRVVPLEQLTDDLGKGRVPRLSFIVGDLCHDMHGGTACPDNAKASLIRAGDRFIKTWVERIRGSMAWRGRSVIFITWDEGRYTLVQRVKHAIRKPRGWGGRVPFLAVKSYGSGPVLVTEYEDHRTFVDTLGALFKVNYPGEPSHPNVFPERLFR